MNTNDLFAFETARALAARFGHGWAAMAHHAEGALTLEEAFDKISSAMDAAESKARLEGECRREMFLGLRPGLFHFSESGRIRWEIGRDGRARVGVARPRGVCIIIELARGKEPKFTFPPSVAREPRHIQAGLWCARALGVEGEYIQEVPPREFHAWRVWFAEEEVGNG